MKHSEFEIGCEFYCNGERWRCTDIGTRVIVAIPMEGQVTRFNSESQQLEIISADESWLNGPPYARAETVFDENDLPALSPNEH